MPKRFVAMGECMVEMAPREDGAYAMGFAGDTFNTAWYAAKCFSRDWTTGYFTAVGEDPVSERMLAFMQASGVKTDRCRRIAAKTVGLYLIQLNDGERSFAYWRSDSAARRLAADPGLLADAVADAAAIYFSGITLAIVPLADRAGLLDAVSAARAAGATVAFDPNLRPRLWASAGEMRDAIVAAAAVADIVLPSFEDEAAHFGDADPMATALRYAGFGAATVAVKNGASTMLCLHEGGVHAAEPPRVERVVDTTAAGDSFNAGFLARLLDGCDPRVAMAHGASIAAQVIARRGALVQVEIASAGEPAAPAVGTDGASRR